MKKLLQLGFVLGLAGALAAAYFTPWFEYTRYPSVTTVVANGGRVEQFVVRLPADRIGAARDLGLPGGEGPSAPARLEHFKLRDVEGNVIGIAARHELEVGAGAETAWLLTIPSRGTIALAASAPGSASIQSRLAASGLVPGRTLDATLSMDQGATARSVAVTGEFQGIELELVETWVVTGMDADGRIRGTLNLNTVARRRS